MNLQKKKIAGVILAAGIGSRMGKTKQLLAFGKTTLLGQVIQNARESYLNEIIVVLGHDAEKIIKATDLNGTKIIKNPDYLKGQSTSLIKGVNNVSSFCDAVMFLLADQPLVSPGIINKLINSHEKSRPLITIPYFKGRRGNPVIIARHLFDRLESITADKGARVLFDEFKESVLKVSVQEQSILADVDTMDDYKQLISEKLEL